MRIPSSLKFLRPLKFLGDERGMTMPMVAAMALVGVGFASLAIDMSYLYYMDGKVQITADAAALAGAGQIPNMSNIREEAIKLARQNLPEDENGEVVTEANITMGNWNSSTRVYTRSGDRSGSSPCERPTTRTRSGCSSRGRWASTRWTSTLRPSCCAGTSPAASWRSTRPRTAR